MSDVGLILILVVLVSGGVIATIGDRLGTRVGKARLSLFNLRPKNTATVVTILTGTLISASTLGILLLGSRTFRDMLLNFGRIQSELRQKDRELSDKNQALKKIIDDLKSTNDRKAQVENELEKARSERSQVESQLKRINESLTVAVEKQKETNAQLQRAEAQRELTRGQLSAVIDQASKLRSEISQLQSESQNLKAQRDQLIATRDAQEAQIAERSAVIEQRDREIGERDRVIAQREEALKKLETDQAALEEQYRTTAQLAAQSQQEAEQIRKGILAVFRTQSLTSALVQIPTPNSSQGKLEAKAAIDKLLQEANRAVLQLLQPGSQETTQILRIQRAEVERVIEQIDDGQQYIVRVQSLANYARGEYKAVDVSLGVIPNQVVYQTGDLLEARLIEPAKMSTQDFQRTIQNLLESSTVRARRAGVLSETIDLGRLQSFGPFLEQLRRFDTPIEVRAIAAENTYTVGPLKIELVAIQNGQIVLRTSG